MQVEDSASEEMWRVLQEDQENKDRQKLQEELKAQQLMQQQRLEQTGVQIIQQVPAQVSTPVPKIKLRQPKLSEEQLIECNPNDVSVQESQVTTGNQQYILYTDASQDDDRIDQTMKVVVPGNRRRYLHLEYYLSQGYKWKYERRRRSSQAMIQTDLKRLMFTPQEIQVANVKLNLETPFVWNYARRWVNFTNYMMSKNRTQSWHYITDHYAVIWKARLYIMKPEQQLSDVERFFKAANWEVYQQRYDQEMKRQLCELVLNHGQLFEFMTEYRLGQRIYSIKKPKGAEVLLKDNEFYENLCFSIISIRLRNKQRQIKVLYRKMQYVEGDGKDKYFVVQKDVHSSINYLITSAILMPGGTPRNVYKWGSFNTNYIKGNLSSSMESLLDSDAHLLYEKINYLGNWIQSYKDLMGS